MKKLMIFMLTVLLVFANMPLVQGGPGCPNGGIPDPDSDFCYSANGDFTVTIDDYTGTETDLDIPGTIVGETVTAIGDGALRDKGLVSVTIPESVKSIGKSAFYFNELTSVTIPEDVTSIGTYAFANNKLTSVTIPGSVESIGERAFMNNKLTSVTIKEGVEPIGIGIEIGVSAFYNNELTSVTIPKRVHTIRDTAFSSNRLERVTFEGSPDIISYSAFTQNYKYPGKVLGQVLWHIDPDRTEEWTNPLSAPTSGDLYAKTYWPAPPTNLSTVAGDAQATVSFTAPVYSGTSDITGYIVKVSVEDVEQSDLTTTKIQDTASPIIVTGLTNGTTYTFKVIATNDGNEGNDRGDSLESVASDAVTPIGPYKVTYDGNGKTAGSVPVDSNSYGKDDEVTLLDNAGNLTKIGHTFVGWNTASDGSDAVYEAGVTYTIGNEDVTLYATWESSNADLKSLSISEGTLTLTPGFSPETTGYTVDVAYDISSITVTADVYDSDAMLKVNGTGVTSGSASPVLDLDEGENTITVEVTAEDGTAKDYTIVVDRAVAPSTNADLNSLNISKGTLTPGFSSGTTSYSAEVTYDISSITVSAAVYDSNATLRMNGSSITSGSASPALNLEEGENTITVEVTAEDGTTKSYTILVDRAVPDIDDEDNENSGNGNTGNGNTGNNQTTTEEITVDVENGDDGTTVSTTTVKRTKNNDRQIKDEVVLSENSMNETIQKLKAQGNKTASIVIPDTRDEVSEVNVTIPKTALNKLKEGKINLEIKTANAKLSIPASTLAQFDEDIYFRVVPIKDQTEKEQVEERTKLEKIVQEVASNNEIRILGRPAIIETNMQNQIVSVTMPLQNEGLPSNEQERQQMFNNLVIFVEHSDGTKELVSSEVTANADGTWDVEFEIEKFSTFSMVHLDGSEQYFAQLEKLNSHQAYIAGYADGTFRPNQDVTRAEMAALLARNLSTTTSENTEFSDLIDTHWAYDSIGQVVSAGLMNGYPNGQFKPDEVLTRAEMAAIAFQWKNLEQLDGSEVFSDTENHWGTSIIAAVSNDNVMNGYPDGSFKPDQTLSRAEAVTVINSILKRGPLKDIEISTWPDVPTHHWAYHSIQEASMSHTFEITDGVETFVEEVE